MSGGSKTKTKTNSNQTATTSLPSWLTGGAQNVYNQAASNTSAPTAYTGELSPDSTKNQKSASSLASSSTGTGQSDLNAARDYTSAAATGTVPTVSSGTFDSAAAAQYTNPYLQAVQQSTLNQMNDQNAQDQQALGDAAQAAGAYGGTRQAVEQALLTKSQEQQKQNYLNQSNADAYNNAQQQFNTANAANMQAQTTNAANQQSLLNRLLSAGAQSAGIGTTASNLNSQDIQNLSATGAVDQNTQAAKDAAAYNDYQYQNEAPLDYYSQLMSILSGSPHDTTINSTGTGTSTTKQSGSLLNSLLGAGQIAASIWSDPRLKRDAALIERMPDGLGVYRFNYLWDDADEPARIGVMADEVERLRPHALGPVVSGFRTVNYSMLGALQ